MRRKDREVKDRSVIDEIIREGQYMTLALCDGDQPYAVPLNYGYDGHDFYFHAALEGRKLDIIRKSPKVSLNISTGFALHTTEIACECSNAFRSVTADGIAEILKDNEEKRTALALIMEHATGRSDWKFPSIMLSRVAVVRIRISSISGKIHE